MEIKEHIKYWIDSSLNDIPVMDNLYGNAHFHWSLFIGHLVIEKYLKAVYVRDNETTPPKTHNLLFIAKNTRLEISKQQEEFLMLVNTFNLEARYSDYKNTFYNKCTKEFTEDNIIKIKEFIEWLKSLKILD